ncbi:uncharacterized protein LOC132790391 [Drosophila nasuta]|uniref:uncharacterized protein LOC132790391 n=1 Tax=Drosophila nasuta TaxID=42062 RepID=UPI00295E8966|nr:uncharacterized protein LOC132790391 [Drosophila nasuta]
MDSYIMSRIDDHEIDCYHQYIAQTNYRCEQPEDEAHMMMLEPHGRVDRPHDTYNPVGVSTYSNAPQSFDAVAPQRAPARSNRQRASSVGTRNLNARNGLGSATAATRTQPPRADCGDYYNSLPGLGNYEQPRLQQQQQHPMRNRWLF